MKKKSIISILIMSPILIGGIILIDKELNNKVDNNVLFSTYELSNINENGIEQYLSGDNSIALVNDGFQEHIYTWGRNHYGQSGVNSPDDQDNPSDITSNFDEIGDNYNIKQVEKGENNEAAIINFDGKDHLYIWGSNQFGQLGNGEEPSENSHYYPIDITNNFNGLDVNKEYSIERVSFGHDYSEALINYQGKDHLYSWGSNSQYALGIGDDDATSIIMTPKEINFDSVSENYSIETFVAGRNHSLAILDYDNSQHIYAWGSNSEGELGNGTIGTSDDKADASTPIEITSNFEFTGTYRFKQIDANEYVSSAIVTEDDGDHLYMWGSNNYGMIGNDTISVNSEDGKTNDFEDLLIPLDITDRFVKKEGFNIKQVSIGERSTMAVINDVNGDHLYTWGSNQYGQLGLGDDGVANALVPQDVTSHLNVDGNLSIKQISIDDYVASAIIEINGKDTIYTWGRNQFGQLGNGSIDDLDTFYDEPQSISPKWNVPMSFNENMFNILSVDKKTMKFDLKYSNIYDDLNVNDVSLYNNENELRTSFDSQSLENGMNDYSFNVDGLKPNTNYNNLTIFIDGVEYDLSDSFKTSANYWWIYLVILIVILLLLILIAIIWMVLKKRKTTSSDEEEVLRIEGN